MRRSATEACGRDRDLVVSRTLPATMLAMKAGPKRMPHQAHRRLPGTGILITPFGVAARRDAAGRATFGPHAIVPTGRSSAIRPGTTLDLRTATYGAA